MDDLGLAVASLPPMSLDRLERLAALQTRVDRKYLVPEATAIELVAAMGDRAAVLEIDGHRSFHYESTYFDTDDLASYRGAAHRRRRRFKVRSRIYREHGTCVLEVKTKGGRGHTVKERMTYRRRDHEHLTPAAQAFVDDRVGEPGLGRRLRPVLSTAYVRSTIVDPTDGCRATIDRRVRATDTGGASIQLHGHVIVETKSMHGTTAADRWLWQRGHRPVRVSKFCVGMAVLRPELPANKWSRVLRRYYGWSPAGGPVPDHVRIADSSTHPSRTTLPRPTGWRRVGWVGA